MDKDQELRRSRAARLLESPTDNAAHHDARRIWRDSGQGDPRPALAEIAEALGHAGGKVEETVARTRWFSWCSCGFVSTTRNTESDALSALVHHLRLAMKAWTRSGLPLEAYPKPPAPDWEKVRRMHKHWALKMAQNPSEEISGNVPQTVRRVV